MIDIYYGRYICVCACILNFLFMHRRFGFLILIHASMWRVLKCDFTPYSYPSPLHLSLKYLQKIKFLLWKIVFYEISIYFSRMFRNFKHLSLFPKVWRELTRKNVRQWKEKFFFQNLFIKYFFKKLQNYPKKKYLKISISKISTFLLYE